MKKSRAPGGKKGARQRRTGREIMRHSRETRAKRKPIMRHSRETGSKA